MVVKIMFSKFDLVGGFNPSEKYESVGIIIPNIWKKMFQTTSQLCLKKIGVKKP